MRFAIHALQRLDAVDLQFEADSADEARCRAEAQGYAVLSVKPVRDWLSLRGGAAARFPLLQFNQSLLILLKAGLSVVEAIEALAERDSRGDSREVLLRLHQQLQTGLALSAALEQQPAVFPALYVASVRANERSGALIEAVERFIVYRSQSEVLRKRVISAAIYPSLTLAVGGLVVCFLLLYVIPRFSQVFQDLGDRIPLMSRLLLQWGEFVHAHGLAVLGGVAGFVAATAYALAQPGVRGALARRIQRLPRIGEHLRTYQLARFYRALGMLQRAGIPIVASLDLVAGLLPASLQPGLAAARRDIVEGRAISDAFQRHDLTTVVSLRLLRVGERSGQMGQMLERTADFHEEDIAQAIDWFIRLFEPLLMLAIGLVIGVVVLLMYAPIFELAGSLQ